MTDIIVTGTDTGVGKTMVSALLATRLKLDYWKPVQSGSPADSQWIETIIGRERVHPEAYRLRRALSPHLAARFESKAIDLGEIHRHRPKKPCVIEGAGGLLVPLNARDYIVDLFRGLAAPILLVAPARLGTINHTLLSIEALRHRGLEPHGVILVGSDRFGSGKAITRHGQVRILTTIPWLTKPTADAISALAQRMEISL